MGRWIVCALTSVCLVAWSISASAKTLFEDDFSSGDLDGYLIGGTHAGNVEIVESNPPENGPQTLFMPELPHEDNLIVAIRDLVITDAIVEILWSDADLPEDADGPLFVRAQIPDGEDPNDPAFDPAPLFDNSYLVELDTDTGLHIDIITAGNGNIEDFFVGAMLSSVDWTWIKMQVDGPRLKLKAWLAADPEPAEWNIEGEDESWQEGMVGFRSWSGTVEVAYVRVTDLDGPGGGTKAVDPGGKLATTWGGLRTTRTE